MDGIIIYHQIMDRMNTGKRIIGDIDVLLGKDSFVQTNFRIEHSGEWKEGITPEYHERLVLYPEDNWIDTHTLKVAT